MSGSSRSHPSSASLATGATACAESPQSCSFLRLRKPPCWRRDGRLTQCANRMPKRALAGASRMAQAICPQHALAAHCRRSSPAPRPKPQKPDPVQLSLHCRPLRLASDMKASLRSEMTQCKVCPLGSTQILPPAYPSQNVRNLTGTTCARAGQWEHPLEDKVQSLTPFDRL
jgi:hypothetical protein